MSVEEKLAKIGQVNPALAAKLRKNGTFVMSDDVPALIAIDRLMLLIVRCGNGRFLCPAQDLNHWLKIIREHNEMAAEKTGSPFAGDYVRDVSLALV